MPASGVIKLPDANVWLALAFSDHQHHRKASEWFESQAPASCAFCRVTQMALLRHLTNSKIMGAFVQSQKSAWGHYTAFTQDLRVIYLDEPVGLEDLFRDLACSDDPSVRLWTDAYLAAFATRSHLQLVTFDQGFVRFSNLDLVVL